MHDARICRHFFWIAVLSPRDSAHKQALLLAESLREATLVTTDEVLNEFVTHFSRSGPESRHRVVISVENIFKSNTILVVAQSRKTFQDGLQLYKSRLDKSYSLTDCISMTVMKFYEITDVLTNDVHFEQEGFNPLFREE